MITKTLVGLACLISQKSPKEASSIFEKLSDEKQYEVATIIESGTCIPQTFEDLLLESQNKLKNGEINNRGDATAPTDMCNVR